VTDVLALLKRRVDVWPLRTAVPSTLKVIAALLALWPALATASTPVPTYGTYFGGTGDANAAVAVAVDPSGNVIVAGYTTSQTLPGTAHAFQPVKATKLSPSNGDVFIAKFDPSGRTLLWATFLGGNGNDSPTALAVDSSGNVYITGMTNSSNLPVTSGAYSASPASGFAAKISANGSSLLYATYISGTPQALAVNSVGDAYIALTPSASLLRLSSAGAGLMLVTGQPTGIMSFSEAATATAVALDVQGNVYVAGYTGRSDIQTTANAFQGRSPNGFVGFIFEVNSSGSQVLYGTYFDAGTTITSIAVAPDGSLYFAGSTGASTLQATPGPYATPGAYLSTLAPGFVAKLTPGRLTLDSFSYIPSNPSVPLFSMSFPLLLEIASQPGVVYVTFGNAGNVGFGVVELSMPTLALVSSFTSSSLGFPSVFSSWGTSWGTAIAVPDSLWIAGSCSPCSVGNLISGNAFQISPPSSSESVVLIQVTDLASPYTVLSISKTHTGNFTRGQNGATYTVTVKNPNSTDTSGTVTVAEILPSGLGLVSMAGVDWACLTNTCRRSDPLSPGASYPPITVTVSVAADAPASVTNTVTVSGGGTQAARQAYDVTTVTQLPLWGITKTHAGSFTQGQVGATYTVAASNIGYAPAGGGVTVTDTLPAGLTATGIWGDAPWNCTLTTFSCTRSDALAVGASYPPITVRVNVADNATSPQVNQATAWGSGSPDASTTDSTIIIPKAVLSIAKTHAGNFAQGQTGANYAVTVSNGASAGPTVGAVTVTEAPPTGLTLVSMAGTGWTCPAGGTTCTRSGALAAGGSYPAITVTVNVAGNATSPQVNAVTVSGGGASAAQATDPAVIEAMAISGSSSLPAGQVGVAYAATAVTATGGSGSYTWSATGLPAGLGIGSATGIISGTPTTNSGSPYTVQLTVTDANSAKVTRSYSLTINAAPVNLPLVAGVANAASGQTAIAPNTWVSIYGANFAAAGFSDDWSKSITGGNLPTTLDGVSVGVGGIPAYVSFVSAGQINVLTPNVASGSISVAVTAGATTTTPFTVTSQPFSPAFFPWPNGQPVATHLDYSWAAKSGTFASATTVPAKPGEYVILWGTGFGPTAPTAPTGVTVPAGTTYYAANPVYVTIGSLSASVYGTALAPGFAGLYQVVAMVPAALSNGDYALVATVGGVPTATTTLTVHN
jgi:uncharacterized protein (TIGR03437 family)